MIELPINKYYSENQPLATILHVTMGDIHRTFGELKREQKSYHYVISKKGTVYKVVDPKHGAWHAGRKNQPHGKSEKLFAGKDPNKYSIGIAYEGEPLDADGNVTYYWNNVVDAEEPNGEQVRQTANILHGEDLPKTLFAHFELARDKPFACMIYKSKVEVELQIFRLIRQLLKLKVRLLKMLRAQ